MSGDLHPAGTTTLGVGCAAISHPPEGSRDAPRTAVVRQPPPGGNGRSRLEPSTFLIGLLPNRTASGHVGVYIGPRKALGRKTVAVSTRPGADVDEDGRVLVR